MKIVLILRRMLSMCPEAWYILIRCLQLCCLLLLVSLVLLLDWGGDMLLRYQSYRTAVTLYEIGQAVLLAGVIVPVCVEDLQGKAS